MHITVTCETCRRELSAHVVEPHAVELLLIGHHAADHRFPHRLRIEVDQGDVDFFFRCRNPDCAEPPEYRARGPLELASAFAIAFHTSHEGHPLEMFINGKRIHPREPEPV